MADNTVSVKITGEDDAGGAFAKATAEMKAFDQVVKDSGRAEVKSHIASSEAIGAHIRALRLLDDAAKELDKPGPSGGGQGVFSRLFSSAGSGIMNALSSALTAVTSSGVGTAVMFGALATAAFGFLAAITPLIASLALVTVGFGAFALLAKNEVSSVFTTLTQHGKQLHQTMKQLDPATRDLVKSIEPLKDQFGKLQQAIQPYIIKAFADGIRILKELFPALRPLVEAAGKALDSFLKSIANWLNGPSGKKFIHWMEVEGPHAMAEFSKGLFILIQVLGRTLDFMMNVGETMRRNWFRYMHDLSQATDFMRIDLIDSGHKLEAAWNATMHAIGTVISWLAGQWRGFESIVLGIWHAIESAAESAASIIEGAVSRIGSALSGLPGMGLISGALSIAGKLGLATGGIVGAAAGGIHGGFRLVGEQGPELVKLPTGSTVYSAQQTPGMLGGAMGGGQVQVVLEFAGGGEGVLTSALLELLRKQIRQQGGNVQKVLGVRGSS